MSVAIIPARGGSKRIPRKNLRDFCGRPMIAWSIRAALDSGCFERILVSSDDEDIARVAREHGADVPFLRPAELADDHTGTAAVVAHALDWLAARDECPALACCIYATAPLVRAQDLREGRALLEAGAFDFCLAVAAFPAPIQRALQLDARGRLSMFWPEHYATRSQDLPAAYYDAGQFYWGRSPAWRSRQAVFAASSCALVLPEERVQDIDTAEDWAAAERKFMAARARPGA